jgi:hypothetical protein
MPNEKLSVQEFAAQIKAKYPEYKEYDDTVLTEAILDKYPVYKGQVDYAPKKKEVTPSPSLGGESPSVVETEPVPNPFFEKLKEVDQAFGQAVAKTPILAELVAGSNSLVGGILDYANMTLDYTRAAMMPGGNFNDKLNYVQQEEDNWSEKAADLFANNQEYIRDTRNAQAGISKEDSYKGIIGLAREGEYGKSAFLLFSGATESVPSIALAATTGVGVVAASAAGSKYREIEDNPAYSPLEKLLFANASGIVEAMAEKMGGSDLAAFRKIFSKQAAVDQYRNSFIQSVRQSDIYKEFLKGGVEEGLEEAMVTSFDQMVTSIKEGKDIDVDKIIDDFLVGFVAGGGTIVTANGMNARGSIKNEKARSKNAQQIKDLKEKKSEATPQEAATIDSMIKKNVSAMRTLIDQDAEFFSTFSKDDQDRVRAIDRELNSIEKQRGLTSDQEIKFLLQSQSLELYAEKEKIESKYRKEEENLLINNATTEQLDEIRKLEALLADKKQRLENVESESAKDVIQSQIVDVENELKAKKQEVIGKVKPAAPQEEFIPEEEPTPVEMELEVPKEAQPASFEDLLSQRVTFETPTGKTEMGRIIDEGNGKMAVRTDDGNIIELGNIDDLKGVEASTLGLAKAEEIVSMEGNEITVRGEKYTNNYSNPLAAINRDEDGNIQSVTLDAADGTKRTFRGTAGDEIAYNIIMSQYTDEQLETELENLAQQDEEINAELAPTPEAEVAPAPEAAPDTEQAPEQQPEPEVTPDPTPEPTPEPAPEAEVKPAVEQKEEEDSLEKKRETNKDLEGRTIPSLRPGGTPSPGLELDIASRLAARGEIMSGNKAPFYRNEEEFYARTIKGQMEPDSFIQLAVAAIINTEIQNQKVLNGEKETPKSELVSKPLDSIERFRMKNDKVEYFGGREIHPKRAWKAIPINRGSGQQDILNSLKAGGSLSKYTANSDKFTKDQILIDAGLKKEEVTATKPKEKATTKPEPLTPPTKSIPSKQDIIEAERGTSMSLNSDPDVKRIRDVVKFGIAVMIEADKPGSKKKKFFKEANPKTKYGFVGPGYVMNDIQEVKKQIIDFVKKYNSQINSIPEEARPKDMLIDSRKKAIDAIKSYVKEKTDPIGVNKILFDTVTIDGVSKVLTFADAIKQMDDSEFVKLKNYTEKSEKKDTGKPTVIAGVQLTDEEAKRAAGYVPPAEDLKNFYVTKKGEPFTVPNKEWWEVAKKVMNLGSSISVRLDIYEGGYDKNPKRKRTKDAPKNIHIYGSDKNRAKSVKDVLEFEYKGLKGIEAVSALEEDFFFRLPNPWIERDESNGKVKRFKPETVGQVQWGNNGMYGFDMITKARAFDTLSKGKGAKKLVMDGYEADNFSDYASESTLPQGIKDLKAEGFDVEKQYISAVAKAFNETEDAVAKALGFKAITDDSEVVAVKFPKTEELVDADIAPSGAYTKQKTQVVNSKELGPIRFTSSMVSKNKQEEFTLQQRIYEEIDSFKLTGPEKIQSPADVAFLLRHLESAASENGFLVVTNQDGDYRTIWLGTGTQSSQVVDELEVAAAVDSARFDMKSEKVFVTFVHNHPSGSLIQSPGDEKVYATFKKYFDNVPGVEFMDGLIVNLDSGKFVTFTDKGRVATPDVAKYEDTVTVPVYSFSRKEIYAPKSERPNPFRGGSDAAQFINKLKINGSNKIGHIVLDVSNSVTYVTFVDPSISAAEWARTMVVDTGRYGTNVIIFAPQSEAAKVQSASNAASKMSSKMSVLDTSIGNPRLRTDGNIGVFEPNIDYVLLEDAEDNFVKEQGYTPLTEEDLDYPSRLKSFMEAIKGFKWTEVQKEIIRYEEKRSSRVSLRMKVLGKALRELNRDLGGNFISRKLKGIEKPEAIKAQMLASRYMSEVDKTSVVDEILKLKNGERILKNLRVIRATFDDTSAAFATDGTFQKLPKETRQNILDNIGTYLHRSYRFFDDPTYKFKFGRLGRMMGLDKAARNQAVEAEFMILHNNWINKLMDEAGYTREQAIQSTLLKADNGKNKGFSKRELLLKEAKDNIDKLIKEYNDLLDNRKKMRAQGKGANIPNSAFLEKKDLPVHIRELLGEVKDPIAVMASTGQVLFEIYEKGKMVELISESITNNLKDLYAKEEYRKSFKDLKPEQQKSILDRVNKEPMIKMNKDITERDKGVYKQVNDPMSPLNTRWIHKDIVEIIQATPIYDTDKEGLVGGFIQTYFFILKNMRMTQVLLNSPTWTKNALGTLYFSLANGWFNPIKQVKNIKAMAEGTLNLNEEYVKMLEEMSENGMIGQSYNVNQIGMSGFAYYYGISGDKSFYDKYVARLRNMAKKGLADLGTTYAAIDDFGKMSIYQNERASFAIKLYGKEYGELTEAQQKKVRAAAAERVKDNTPTWGRITKVGRAFQRAPIGDFQGFRFEAFRSTYRIIANATDDVRKLISDKTLSKEQRAEYVKDIARKMAGIGFVSSSAPYVLIKAASYGTAAVASILSMFGFDDDEETKEQREARIKALDAAVVVRPGWLDGHKIWVRSIDNDLKVRVYDYTGFDPYAEVFDVANWGGVAGDMFGANMAAENLVSLSKNEDVYGRPIADPSDPLFQRIMDYAKYGGSKFVPSVISSSFRDAAKKQEEIERARRLLKLNGLNPDDFNLEEVNLPKEAAKLIDERKFIRDYEYDMVQQFRYAVKGYKKSFGENYLTTKYPKNRKRILDDVREMYQAVYTVAMYKGNLEKIDEVTRIVKTNFDDIEESYIFDPRADLSGYFPEGYFK